MTIKDRRRGMRGMRLDLAQLGDELAKHMQDHEQLDLGSLDRPKVDLAKAREAAGAAVHDAADRAGVAVHDAADRARQAIDRAGEQARTLRHDLPTATPDVSLDDLGQRIVASARTGRVRDAIDRVARVLPETPGARKAREARTRSRLIVIGLVAGLACGVAALLFDPKRGKARRQAVGRRVSSVTRGLADRATGTAKRASNRAHGISIEGGPGDPAASSVPSATGAASAVAAPAWPADEGPLEQPLHDSAFGAHEALPEELVSAMTGTTDPGEPTFRA